MYWVNALMNKQGRLPPAVAAAAFTFSPEKVKGTHEPQQRNSRWGASATEYG